MVYSLSYRRPSHVPSSRESLNGDEKQKSINDSISSGSSCMSNGIPEALSFDRIISGGVCPPCTVRDFLNYLIYVERSAENLQFFLWYRDYCTRFEQLSRSDKALSPEWTAEQAEASAMSNTQRRSMPMTPEVAAVLKGTDFAGGQTKSIGTDAADPFTTPSKSSADEKRDPMSDYGSSMGDEKTLNSSAHQTVASQAFEDAGKLPPFSILPYRGELDRVISIYIAEGSPRELNLSGRERQAVLDALQTTTHPTAFRSVVRNVEYSLRRQAHPNFIRWTICNGNQSRVVFARGLGVAGILAGFVADLLLTLSHASRPWRVIPFLAWFIGIATLIAAWKGMCVVLHGMHHRHVRPWELFSNDPDEVIDEKLMSHDSLISESTNSYEDEPWIAKYKKRNVIRKIFDREIWIQEPALRQIQDTIFLQSLLGAFVLSAIFVAIFCAVPRGNFY